MTEIKKAKEERRARISAHMAVARKEAEKKNAEEEQRGIEQEKLERIERERNDLQKSLLIKEKELEKLKLKAEEDQKKAVEKALEFEKSAIKRNVTEEMSDTWKSYERKLQESRAQVAALQRTLEYQTSLHQESYPSHVNISTPSSSSSMQTYQPTYAHSMQSLPSMPPTPTPYQGYPAPASVGYSHHSQLPYGHPHYPRYSYYTHQAPTLPQYAMSAPHTMHRMPGYAQPPMSYAYAHTGLSSSSSAHPSYRAMPMPSTRMMPLSMAQPASAHATTMSSLPSIPTPPTIIPMHAQHSNQTSAVGHISAATTLNRHIQHSPQ